MKIVAITQARVGSSRLPAKVLKTIGNRTLLELHLHRALKSKRINQLVVATTTETDADKIVAVAQEINVDVYCGSVNDVLDRYYQTAKKFEADYVVRITSDCPLIDPQMIDQVIGFAFEKGVDYVSNTLEPSFPDGQDVEVFKFAALEKAWKEAKLPSEREHVTAYIWKNSTWLNQPLFTSANLTSPINYSEVRMTIDELNDFETIKALMKVLGADADWESYAKYYQSHPEEMFNSNIVRNEGYLKSLSNEK